MLSKAWQFAVVMYLSAAGLVGDFLDARRPAVGRGRLMAEAVAGPAPDRAQTSVSGIIRVIIGLAVGGLVAAFILPIALDELAGVDVSNWSDGAQSLWGILDVIVVLVVFLVFIFLAVGRSDRM